MRFVPCKENSIEILRECMCDYTSILWNVCHICRSSLWYFYASLIRILRLAILRSSSSVLSGHILDCHLVLFRPGSNCGCSCDVQRCRVAFAAQLCLVQGVGRYGLWIDLKEHRWDGLVIALYLFATHNATLCCSRHLWMTCTSWATRTQISSWSNVYSNHCRMLSWRSSERHALPNDIFLRREWDTGLPCTAARSPREGLIR